jgi:hypothetical protein
MVGVSYDARYVELLVFRQIVGCIEGFSKDLAFLRTDFTVDRTQLGIY